MLKAHNYINGRFKHYHVGKIEKVLKNKLQKLEKQMISDLMLLHKANNVEQSERTKAPMMSWKEAYDL